MRAYIAGFNDYCDHIYHNTYPPQSAQWQAYIAGFTDAKRAKAAERMRH